MFYLNSSQRRVNRLSLYLYTSGENLPTHTSGENLLTAKETQAPAEKKPTLTHREIREVLGNMLESLKNADTLDTTDIKQLYDAGPDIVRGILADDFSTIPNQGSLDRCLNTSFKNIAAGKKFLEGGREKVTPRAESNPRYQNYNRLNALKQKLTSLKEGRAYLKKRNRLEKRDRLKIKEISPEIASLNRASTILHSLPELKTHLFNQAESKARELNASVESRGEKGNYTADNLYAESIRNMARHVNIVQEALVKNPSLGNDVTTDGTNTPIPTDILKTQLPDYNFGSQEDKIINSIKQAFNL